MKIPLLLLMYLLSLNRLTAQTIVINNTRTASHVPLPKNKLSLVPPANYIALPNDAGFFLNGSVPENGDEQIKVSKFFLDFATVKQSLIKDGDGHQDVSINNYEGVWVKSKEIVEGHVFTSLTLAFGNTAYSYVVAGAFPLGDATIEDKLKRAIQSPFVDTFGYKTVKSRIATVAWRMEVATKSFEDKLDARFSVDVSGTNFKPAEIISDDYIIYTLDGAFPPITSDKSKIEVNHIGSTVSEASYITYSTQLLRSNIDFNTLSNIVTANANIDGLKGIEITADAVYTSPANPVKIYQLTLFQDNDVYFITGIAYQNPPQTIEVIKKIAETFKRTGKL